jgi:hypothetical protein
MSVASLRSSLPKPRKVWLLGALFVGQTLAFAHAADTTKAQDFAGDWKYKQTCGYQHSATLSLTATDRDVTGDWTDGTRLNGSDGSLKGSLRDGKLYVRYCGGDADAGYPVCPAYEAEASAYFVRQGGDLVWYRKSDKTFERYLVLHPLVKGGQLPLDTDCKGVED